VPYPAAGFDAQQWTQARERARTDAPYPPQLVDSAIEPVVAAVVDDSARQLGTDARQ
jgi:hypothetical protein